MTGVFITGATGNVGSAIVKEYLDQSERALYVLVRGETDDAACERFNRILDFWNVDAEAKARVRVVRGDILDDRLGIKPSDLTEIVDNVSVVIHAASNLRLDLPIEKARREILESSKEVFGLAQELRTCERFGYLSTMEVMGGYRGVIKEEFLTDHNIPFYNSYEQAKFETEEFLREQVGHGFPITIFA